MTHADASTPDARAPERSARAIAAHLDALLETAATPDYAGAVNGLQCDNREPIRRVAAAVDFSRRTIEGAIAAEANLLVVHHGMFWGGAQPVVGPAYERLRLLLEHDVAVYASHIPLDRHPTLGNNVLLAGALELEPEPGGGFGEYKGIHVGVRGACDLPTSELVRRADSFAREHGGLAIATPHAPTRRTRRWALCTGGSVTSETLREARALGVDTFISGEGPHHTAVEAAEHDLVVIYAGHYATETLGVQAVARHLEARFGIPWSFVAAPTGL